MNIGPELLVSVLGPLAGGLAAYVAIRVELVQLRERMNASDKRADAADKRADWMEREMGVLRQWLHSLRGEL